MQAGVGTVGWHTFRLPTPANSYWRCPATGKLKTMVYRRDDATDWCMIYIKGPWTEIRPQGNNQHTFQIKDGKDAMLFKLTWCNETVKPTFA